MKKTLAAVAVLGAFAGSAFAADVTLYGRVDAGLLYQRVDADIAHQAAENSWGLESGTMPGSRFGVKGSEQITDDITVSFTLENGFKSDTGQFILGSSWGGMTGGTELITDATSSRLDNMVTYKSPKFAGVTVLAQYGMGDQGVENTSQTDRYYGVAAVGNWGALSAMLGFEQTNYKSSFAATDAVWGDVNGKWDIKTPAKAAYAEDQDDSIGVEASVAYDFGFVKTALTGRYFKDGAGYNSIVDTYDIERIDGYGVKLAAAAPLLGGTVQGMVGYMDAESSDTKVEDLEVSRYTVALTYEYPLSKRTKLYTAASYTKDDFTNNDVEDGSKDGKPTNTAFMFGMAHYF